MVTGCLLLRMNGEKCWILGLGSAFKCLFFFIVHTADMGLGIVVFNLMSRYLLISCIVCFYSLGIQAAKTVKTCKLSEFLHGFLEIITEDQFRQLKRLHYPSLYAMKYHLSADYFGLTIISLCLKVDHLLQ